jgi:type I restriction enzyme S subunit
LSTVHCPSIPPGYKQTEVGVIPEEWGIRPLGLICDVRDGTHESPRFFKDGVPFVTSKNIVNGRLDLENVSFISKSDAAEFDKRSKVDRNDILLSMIGTIGSAVLVDFYPAFCIKNVALIKPRKVDPTYLIRLINAPVFQKYLADNLDGGIQKFISLGKLRQLAIPLPDETEQRAIAEALSDVDGLLGGLDRLIAKKRDLKQAAMQQLLTGQTRLPGFHGEWVVKRLDSLADIRSGGTPSTGEPRFWDGDVPWCTPTDITALNGHKYLGETARTITQLGLKASSAEMIPAHSVVMTSRATIGECAINVVPVSTNQGFKNFVPFGTTDVDFLYYLLGTQKQGFISLCGGSTFLEIGKTQLAAYKVRLPSTKAEQTAIAEVLTDMDAELAALEQRREKTRALKQAMMQELLTGRTRLV